MVRPDRLWTCILAAQPSYADHGQQDLLECFRFLLGHSELAGAVESSRVWQMKCEEDSGGCGFTSLDTDRVTTWNVTVPAEGDGPPLDVQAFLQQEMQTVNTLPGWTCPCCGRLGGVRRPLGRTAPDCLVIHVLRFAWGDGTLHKLPFPVRLPFEGISVAANHGTTTGGCAFFSLKAFATHRGGPHDGHYGASVLREGKWWVASDMSISEGEPHLLQDAEHDVYALFLQRMPGGAPCWRRGPARCRGQPGAGSSAGAYLRTSPLANCNAVTLRATGASTLSSACAPFRRTRRPSRRLIPLTPDRRCAQFSPLGALRHPLGAGARV